MREIYAIYQHYLTAILLAAPLAALVAYGFVRLARAARSAGLRRALLAALFAAPAIYLGATKSGRVTVDDAYIEDAGSYLTNDIAHIAIAKKTALLPDDTSILVYARETSSTNAADWSRLSPYLAYSGHPYDYALPNATNYNVMVAADYTPPPTVHTNGVWVCYAGELWSTADATAYGLPASKIRTILTARSYLTELLVAQYDGIENAGYNIHDPAATTWVDLIGGNNLVHHGGVVSATEDGYYFPGTNTRYKESINRFYGLDATGYTIMVVTTPVSAPPVTGACDMLCFQYNTYNYGFALFYYTQIRGFGPAADLPSVVLPPTRVKMAYTRVSNPRASGGRKEFINNVMKYSDSATQNPVDGVYLTIGALRPQFYPSARTCGHFIMHAVRIYKGCLTDEQLKREMEIDRIRFGFTY